MFRALQRSTIFPRHLTQTLPHVANSLDGESLWIETDEGKVEAWFLPATAGEGPRPLLVFAHGNAELIDYWPAEKARYRQMGFHVLMPEYRGYGRSAGKPSESAIRQDFVSFYDLVTSRSDVDASRVAYHGRSLGGGAVCQLASVRKPNCMILESTFSSIADIAASLFIPRAFVSDPFDNIAIIKHLDLPILILHGVHDLTVPFEHAQRLQRVAPNARLVSFRSGHSDLPDDPVIYEREITKLLTGC